jgi:hypothetical protein
MRIRLGELRRLIREVALSPADAFDRGLALFVNDRIIILYQLPVLAGETTLQNQLLLSVRGVITMSSVDDLDSQPIQIVKTSYAEKGFGPLVYDAALSRGIWVAPDRKRVSPAAEHVWRFFYERRSDVEHKPLPAENVVYHSPWLDAAYRMRGRADLSALTDAHQASVDEFADDGYEQFLMSAGKLYR